MILSLRRRRANKKKTQIPESDSEMTEIVIPAHFRCPITLDLMKDPVTLSTGITYDRDSIEKWIESGNRTCPVTNQVLKSFDQIPNHTIRRMIQDWCVQNRSHGVERIPTPRIPVTPYEVSSVCERIAVATRNKDRKRCQELVGKMKIWAKESERNRKCMVNGGIGRVLLLSFEAFAVVFSAEELGEQESANVRVLLEQILSVLSWVPDSLGDGLQNDTSLRCLVSFLQGNDLSARQNAVLVIKELLASDQGRDVAVSMAEIDGGVEALVRMIKEPVSPKAMKASLTAVFHVINTNKDENSVRSRFVDLGLVSLLLENILEGEKGVSERSLRVFNVVCDSEEGREKAYDNALTIPLVVKKILRVSDLASELLVSILWKLCKNAKSKEEDDFDQQISVVVEALQVGAFEKLLVVLQIGCGAKTKEKVTELLKLFNIYRQTLNCDDSSAEFKYLKKPF